MFCKHEWCIYYNNLSIKSYKVVYNDIELHCVTKAWPLLSQKTTWPLTLYISLYCINLSNTNNFSIYLKYWSCNEILKNYLLMKYYDLELENKDILIIS